MVQKTEHPHAPEFTKRDVGGDSLKRSVCDRCGFIDYQNPKVIVGSAIRHKNRILMCKRAIEPRIGYWTLPAGFLELHETAEEGAMREAQEEACAEIEIERLLAVYSVTHISQVQLIYKAHLVRPEIAPGPESQEVALMEWDEIPWTELAFPSVFWTLNYLREVWDTDDFTPFGNPPEGKYPFPVK